jgi:hypothetical protein
MFLNNLWLGSENSSLRFQKVQAVFGFLTSKPSKLWLAGEFSRKIHRKYPKLQNWESCFKTFMVKNLPAKFKLSHFNLDGFRIFRAHFQKMCTIDLVLSSVCPPVRPSVRLEGSNFEYELRIMYLTG